MQVIVLSVSAGFPYILTVVPESKTLHIGPLQDHYSTVSVFLPLQLLALDFEKDR